MSLFKQIAIEAKYNFHAKKMGIKPIDSSAKHFREILNNIKLKNGTAVNNLSANNSATGKTSEFIKNDDKIHKLNMDSEGSKNKIIDCEEFLKKHLDENGCLRLSDSSVFEDGFFFLSEDIKEVLIYAEVDKIPEQFLANLKIWKKSLFYLKILKKLAKWLLMVAQNFQR